MKYTICLSVIHLFLAINCQNMFGQEISGNIKINLDEDIRNIDVGLEFVDNEIDTPIQAFAFAHVDFNHYLPYRPVKVFIQSFGMRELREDKKNSKVNFNILLNSTKKSNLNDFEKKLFEKYLPKVDSIYVNSRYEFVGKGVNKKRMAVGFPYSRRMGIGFSFKIKPE